MKTRSILKFLVIVFFSVLPSISLSQEKLVEVTLEVPRRFSTPPFTEKRVLKAPPGFKISVFASGLKGVRFMAVGPGGHIFATIPSQGRVVVIPDRDRDGVGDSIETFAEGLARPHGIAFRGDEAIVAETGSLLLLKDADGDLRADARRVISEDIPPLGGHWTRTVAIGPDGGYYVSVGSTCNACIEKERRRAAILKISHDGGKSKILARGLRNSVGIAFHPETGELWGVDNGRDLLGDDLPPEELNLIKDGGDYGWPHCYGDKVPDPEYGSRFRCARTTPPQVKMQAHSAPLGIAFGSGLKFPAVYRDVLLVAFHGSWNRTIPTGYKLVAIPFDKKGRPSGPPFDFVTGWLDDNTGNYWGRPVFPLVGSDGALYLSDDFSGTVYRISG